MIPADREPGLKVSPRQGDRSSLRDGWHSANPQGLLPSPRGSQGRDSAHPSCQGISKPSFSLQAFFFFFSLANFVSELFEEKLKGDKQNQQRNDPWDSKGFPGRHRGSIQRHVLVTTLCCVFVCGSAVTTPPLLAPIHLE